MAFLFCFSLALKYNVMLNAYNSICSTVDSLFDVNFLTREPKSIIDNYILLKLL